MCTCISSILKAMYPCSLYLGDTALEQQPKWRYLKFTYRSPIVPDARSSINPSRRSENTVWRIREIQLEIRKKFNGIMHAYGLVKPSLRFEDEKQNDQLKQVKFLNCLIV